jgi:hypothetical protein
MFARGSLETPLAALDIASPFNARSLAVGRNASTKAVIMIRSTFSRVLLGFGLIHGSLFVSACNGGDSASEQETTEAGTLSMPLLTSTGGHTYRLQGAIQVYGPGYAWLDLSPDAPVLTTSLQTGHYDSYLYGWSLTRDDGAGNFLPVQAQLTSSPYPSFDIFNQTTTTISFEFETDGQIVTVGTGSLNIDVHVTETPGVCTPLGSGCAEGQWCAPPELTGVALACIAEGPAAAGAPCNSPLDCAANTSCFDFGAGAVCAPLCTAADFGQLCGSGGTCTPQGVDYGVCQPAPDAP